jgi:hypothetical protein
MFSTSDGKIFALTDWIFETNEASRNSYIRCYSLSGVLLAEIEEDVYRFHKMTGQLESDGVFRVYAIGYNCSQDEGQFADSYKHDVLVCYS